MHSDAHNLLREASARDRDWLLPMAAVAAANLLLSFYLSPLAGVPRLGAFAVLALVVISCLVLLRTGWILFRDREPTPIAKISSLARANRRRAFAVLAATYLSAISGACFGLLKVAIPTHNPFWMDPYLLAVEGPLWKTSHALLGWATPLIDLIYSTWLPVQVVAFYSLLIARPSHLKSQALISHALIWLFLGTVAALVGSSVGPIFYDRVFGGTTFAELNSIIARDAPIAFRTSELLWRVYSENAASLVAGISAMPSLHVGMALWLCLLLRGRWRSVAAVYFALIFLGSVHLGWHYFLDGAVAVFGVVAIWRFSGIIGRLRLVPAPIAATA